ncbi:MAG: phytoene desaturase family protein [Puniceicoccaceae bacterium]
MEASQGGDSFDSIIIGCGMAGLAAGIRLAMYGQRVVILEKHNAPGGLNSFYFLGGRKFDVGLHAVTNFVEPQGRGTPLGTLIRQLRLPRDAFQLCPQAGSRIAFPGVDLRFNNDFSLLESEVARAFPEDIDAFRKLRQVVLEHDALNLEAKPLSAREVVSSHLGNPVLADMLFCPLMYYGSAREHDMDFDQFVTLWKAIFEEGFARPLEGVRVVIRALLDKYRSLGGVRRMKCGVRRILLEGDKATGVELENGEVLQASHILSTAGWAETKVLCGSERSDPQVRANIGRLSFAETISVLDGEPRQLGLDETIVFFNDSERFHYEQAAEPFDLHSGVICVPNNYCYADGESLPEGILRITGIASHALWTGFDEATYQAEKAAWFPRIVESALRFVPEASPDAVQERTVFQDMFTPRTVEKFTSHFGGAVYGAPNKSKSGRTEVENVYLAGTDQGFLGIVGAMLSGISMANKHILMAKQ